MKKPSLANSCLNLRSIWLSVDESALGSMQSLLIVQCDGVGDPSTYPGIALYGL